MSLDEFRGELAGLLLVEAEFESDEALQRFSAPPFATREVTNDPAFTGGALAKHGLPPRTR